MIQPIESERHDRRRLPKPSYVNSTFRVVRSRLETGGARLAVNLREAAMPRHRQGRKRRKGGQWVVFGRLDFPQARRERRNEPEAEPRPSNSACSSRRARLIRLLMVPTAQPTAREACS